MLFPLVEPCIKKEISRTWIRNLVHKLRNRHWNRRFLSWQLFNNKEFASFLWHEIEESERISIAKSGFKYIENKGQAIEMFKKIPEVNAPVVSNLFSRGKYYNKKELCLSCVFVKQVLKQQMLQCSENVP